MYFIFFWFQFCEISINGNTSDESYINKTKTETKDGLTSSLPSRTTEKGEGREGYACTSHEVRGCSKQIIKIKTCGFLRGYLKGLRPWDLMPTNL